jgi:hypothetical protein
VCFLHLPSSKTSIIQIIGRALRLHQDKSVANIILPYSVDEDGKHINNFLSILSSNDSRIKKTCTDKKLSGYVDIFSVIEDNESETNDSVEEVIKEDVDLKVEMIYKNMGTQMITPQYKGELLLEYVEKEGKLPFESFVLELENKIEVRLGGFWRNVKYGHNENVLKYLISKSIIIKEDYERYLKTKEENKDKKEYTPKEKGELLLDYVIENKKLPPSNFILEFKDGSEIKLGGFWAGLKSGNNKDILKYLIVRNNTIKEEYQRYLKTKEEKKSKKEYTSKEKGYILLNYVIENKKMPTSNFVLEFQDGSEIQLGSFWGSLKSGHNKDILDDLIGKNNIIKEEYERYLIYKEEKKDKKEYTSKEKGEYLLKYVIEYEELPPRSFVLVLEDGSEIQLGEFWKNLKSRQNKELLECLISKSNIIKEEYEKYKEYKEEKKDKKEFTPKEKGKYLLDYVIEYEELPSRSFVLKFEDGNEIQLGSFWTSLKSGNNKDLLECLISKSNIIKEEYEKYKEYKEEKKDKKEYTPKEKSKYLLDYVIEYEELPTSNFILELEDGSEVKLGSFWTGLKSGKNKEVLDDLISKSDIIKEDYERYLKNKEEKKDKN